MPAADVMAYAQQQLAQALADPVPLVALVSAAVAGALVIVGLIAGRLSQDVQRLQAAETGAGRPPGALEDRPS